MDIFNGEIYFPAGLHLTCPRMCCCVLVRFFFPFMSGSKSQNETQKGGLGGFPDV